MSYSPTRFILEKRTTNFERNALIFTPRPAGARQMSYVPTVRAYCMEII